MFICNRQTAYSRVHRGYNSTAVGSIFQHNSDRTKAMIIKTHNDLKHLAWL